MVPGALMAGASMGQPLLGVVHHPSTLPQHDARRWPAQHTTLLFDHLVGTAGRPAISRNGRLWNIDQLRRLHSGLILATRITRPHFSVVATISARNSAARLGIGIAVSSSSRPLIRGSASAALSSRFSSSVISRGVPVGTPTPKTELAS